MSTKIAPQGAMPNDLAAQNEELWRIVERQRMVIQNLQKSLALVTSERDGLLERTQTLEQAQIMNAVKNQRDQQDSTESARPQREVNKAHEEHEPRRDDEYYHRTNVRARPDQEVNTQKAQRYQEREQQQPQKRSQQESSYLEDPSAAGPVPPPRSPYRQNVGRENSASPVSTASNGSYTASYDRYNQDSEPRMGATVIEPSMPATYVYDNRNRQQQRSATDPEPRKVATVNPAYVSQQLHHQETKGNQQHISAPDMSVSPVDMIVDKDAQLFAKYQDAIQRKDAHYSTPTRGTPAAPKETTLSPPPGRKQTSEYQSMESPTTHQMGYAYSSQQEYRATERSGSNGIPQINHPTTINSNTDYHRDDQKQVHPPVTSSTPRSSAHSETSQPPPPPAPSATGAAAGPMAGIKVEVVGSHIFTNDKGKEVAAFTISVKKRKDPSDPNSSLEELWRIQKLYSEFLALDTQLKSQRSVVGKIAKLPDKALFTTNSPNKVDQRRMAVEAYLQHAISLPLMDVTDLCAFLSSNVIDKSSYTKVPKYKQGYLTKRGKNFGGLKKRFFVLDGPDFKYYEDEDGQYLGSIRLTEAQIGKQIASPEAAKEVSFKHAFLILEPKKSAPGGVARHVLCAESDSERDAWVDAIKQYIDHEAAAASAEKRAGKKGGKVSKDDIKPVTSNKLQRRSSLDTSYFKQLAEMAEQNQKMSVGQLPVNFPGNGGDDESDADSKKKGRKAFWPKMFAGSNNGAPHSTSAGTSGNGANGLQGFGGPGDADWRKDNEPRGKNQVFGIPLKEAIQVARVREGYELPAIVYRCIDFLEARNAIQEEGIYRLSGSAVKIRNLKARFNEEGDVDLLNAAEPYDVHAVAGLLKMWLRELPGNVLTNELLKEFLDVMDLVDRRERVDELGRLVSMLPIENYTLLRTLSAHLIRVVQHAGVNKMTMRNVGIVFSATLGIPAGIFSLLLTEFDYIFYTHESNSPSRETHAITSPSSQQSPIKQNVRVQALQEDRGRSNRNSVSYTHGAPQSIVGLEQYGEKVLVDDEEVEDLGLPGEDDFVGSSDDDNVYAYRSDRQQQHYHHQQHHYNAHPYHQQHQQAYSSRHY